MLNYDCTITVFCNVFFNPYLVDNQIATVICNGFFFYYFRNKTNLIWSCIKWVSPTVIIITSAFGEIIKVKLQNNRPPLVTLLSESHKDVIFSIACPTYVKYN